MPKPKKPEYKPEKEEKRNKYSQVYPHVFVLQAKAKQNGGGQDLIPIVFTGR